MTNKENTKKAEIMVAEINVNALANKELSKNLVKMSKAVSGANKNAWDYAKALADIFNKEQYKEDFGEKKVFAEKAGISAGRVSQCTKAVQFATIYKLTADDITVDNAYCIGAITKKDITDKGKKVTIDDYVGFLAYMLCHYDIEEKDVFKLSNGKLKEYIKEYKEDRDNVIDVEVTAEEDITESKEDEFPANENIYLMPAVPYMTIGAESDSYVLVTHIHNGEDIVDKYPKTIEGMNELMLKVNKSMSIINNAPEKVKG